MLTVWTILWRYVLVACRWRGLSTSFTDANNQNKAIPHTLANMKAWLWKERKEKTNFECQPIRAVSLGQSS